MTRFHFTYLWFNYLHFAHLRLVSLAFRNPLLCLPLEKHIFRQKKNITRIKKLGFFIAHELQWEKTGGITCQSYGSMKLFLIYNNINNFTTTQNFEPNFTRRPTSQNNQQRYQQREREIEISQQLKLWETAPPAHLFMMLGQTHVNGRSRVVAFQNGGSTSYIFPFKLKVLQWSCHLFNYWKNKKTIIEIFLILLIWNWIYINHKKITWL